MKLQCDVCENAAASVMCCADEAALCTECDGRIHTANKLANKHQRINLLYPTLEELTCCDICQDKVGFFFCLEDRALLCRSCDYSIHSTNALTAKHKRFLVSGVRVSVEAMPVTDENAESDSSKINASELSSPRMAPLPKVTHRSSSSALTDSQESHKVALPLSSFSHNLTSHEQTEKCAASLLESKRLHEALPAANSNQEVMVVLPSNLASVPPNPFNHQVHFNSAWEMHPSIGGVQADNMNLDSVLAKQRGGSGFVRRSSISEYLIETIPGWRVDELLSVTDASSTRNFADCGSSKMDTWNHGDIEWQADWKTFEESFLAQGPAEVPSVPSPPGSSGFLRSTRGWGLGKFVRPSDLDCLLKYDDAPVVPDIGGVASPPMRCPTSLAPKRRRFGVDF